MHTEQITLAQSRFLLLSDHHGSFPPIMKEVFRCGDGGRRVERRGQSEGDRGATFEETPFYSTFGDEPSFAVGIVTTLSLWCCSV
jgi:hypothetical protein